MRLFEQIGSLRTYLRGLRGEGKTIGFVATMGALHEGHLTLCRRACAECDITVASIFVNPTQFGPQEDFTAYPRPLQRDAQLAQETGVAALFIPSVAEMYPEGFQTRVELSEISRPLEGSHRPGHFVGVATVVAKLFNIVQPDRAYFGQKDYQQALVIDRLAHDLNMPLEVVVEPTVREADGLALSSRNTYLSSAERQAASCLYRSLMRVRDLLASGEKRGAVLQAEMETIIHAERAAKVEYAAIADPATLAPITEAGEGPVAALLAVRIGNTRLIDNMLFSPVGQILTFRHPGRA